MKLHNFCLLPKATDESEASAEAVEEKLRSTDRVWWTDPVPVKDGESSAIIHQSGALFPVRIKWCENEEYSKCCDFSIDCNPTNE